MVKLDKIYTRAGDKCKTRLSTGQPVDKWHPRVVAYGSVDEANAAIGLARLYTGEMQELDAVLARLQNDLFDLGADLATPENVDFEALRIVPQQVARLESEIDRLNGDLTPLESFVLPGGHPAAAHLHLARTIMRRAERILSAATAQTDEAFSEPARAYINRASDLLFVAARAANAGENGAGDILWQPAATRQPQ